MSEAPKLGRGEPPLAMGGVPDCVDGKGSARRAVSSERGTEEEKDGRWWPGAGDEESDGGLMMFLEGEAMFAELYKSSAAYRMPSSKQRRERTRRGDDCGTGWSRAGADHETLTTTDQREVSG